MEKDKKKRLFDLIQSAVALILSVTALLSVVFSWYSLSRTVNVSGISLRAQSPDISIGDPLSDAIWVVRNLTGETFFSTYKKDPADGNYYECHGGEWVLDEPGYEGYYVYRGGEWAYTLIYDEVTQEWEQVRRTLSVKGIWPGESIDFFIPVQKDIVDALSVNLRFENIEGDIFEDMQENPYSILVTYRVNVLDEEGNELDGSWLDFYNESNPQPPVERIKSFSVISNQQWGEGEAQIILRFRITFDIAQIKDKVLTNALSQKRFSIGRIIVTAK